MSWITQALEALGSLPTPVVLGVAAAFSAAESGLGIGIAVPGDTAVLLAGAAARGSTAVLIALFALVALAASGGDHVGYLLGRRYGRRLRHLPLVRRIEDRRWDRAVEALHRHGVWAVFLTRLLPVVRTLTPPAAGIARVRYRRFLPASLAGSALWSALYVFGGALAGASAMRLGEEIGTAGLAVLLALAAALCVTLLLRRREGRPGRVR